MPKGPHVVRKEVNTKRVHRLRTTCGPLGISEVDGLPKKQIDYHVFKENVFLRQVRPQKRKVHRKIKCFINMSKCGNIVDMIKKVRIRDNTV